MEFGQSATVDRFVDELLPPARACINLALRLSAHRTVLPSEGATPPGSDAWVMLGQGPLYLNPRWLENEEYEPLAFELPPAMELPAVAVDTSPLISQLARSSSVRRVLGAARRSIKHFGNVESARAAFDELEAHVEQFVPVQRVSDVPAVPAGAFEGEAAGSVEEWFQYPELVSRAFDLWHTLDTFRGSARDIPGANMVRRDMRIMKTCWLMPLFGKSEARSESLSASTVRVLDIFINETEFSAPAGTNRSVVVPQAKAIVRAGLGHDIAPEFGPT